MKIRILILLALIAISQSCNKPDDEYCWQVIDDLGNHVYLLCNKTEAEMQDEFPNPCHYYKTGPDFCWYVDNNIFIENRPESFIELGKNCFGFINAVKVPCDYCAKYYTREKHTYKPTGAFTFSPVRFQQYCGDTAQTLFHGREIILRDTPDSLITVKFSNDGTF